MKIRIPAFYPALILVILTGLTAGCGTYSASSGRVDQSIKKVAVEYLENRTSQPDIGVGFTDLIIEAIREDNTLKVVNYEAADSVIEGVVSQYRLRQAGISQEQQVDEYQVQIAVELTFRVKESGETVFSKQRFTGVGTYYLNDTNDPPSSELTAQREAAAEITRDILAMVVEDW